MNTPTAIQSFREPGRVSYGRLAQVAVAGLVLTLGLAGCSTVRGIFGSDKSEPTVGKSRTADGATPKFAQPKYTGEGAPDLASVPDSAPTPPSSKKEREAVIEGLIADRDRAKHTDQDSRVEPIDVRPLAQAPAITAETPAAPPKAKGAPVQPVTKLQTMAQDKPATPDEMAAKAGLPAPPPPPPEDVGRAQPPSATIAAAGPTLPTTGRRESQSGPRTFSALGVRSDGFRSLESFEKTSARVNRVATIDFGASRRELSAADRRALTDAAQLGKTGAATGTYRVIGRSDDASEISQARSLAVARELQRAGIAQDRIFVGTDVGTGGTVDVIFDN